MRPGGRTSLAGLVEYDALHRRLWIRGQRCHHGAAGSIVALSGCLALLAGHAPAAKEPTKLTPLAVLALAGGALMAHDWKDRSVWFERGHGARR